ncbi:MAG: ABC transporter permease subunit [Hyphomonadaceae bacterium]
MLSLAPSIAAVTVRELRAYFLTPLAYVFIAIFLLALGAFTFEIGGFFRLGQASLSSFFVFHPWLYVVFMPAVAMRLWADESRSGGLELLLSLPTPVWAIVAGKFLAAWAVAGAALLLSTPMWMTVAWLGSPDNAAILITYLASFLMAGAYLAVACVLSALTSSSVIAFVLSAAVCFVITAAGLPLVASGVASAFGPGAADALAMLSTLRHFETAQSGVLELRAVIYFLSLIALCLYLTSLAVDARRER